MRVGSPIVASKSPQAEGVSLGYPFFYTDFKAVQPGLAFNYGEFARVRDSNYIY